MELEEGTQLGPYQVLSMIGKGGMGDVYRALDTRLARHVALKVLSNELSQDSKFVDRFEKETRALAALSHPNILTIFDVGKHEGIIFAVMELLDGETLRSRLKRGKLDWEKGLEIGTETAYGLMAAHSKDIIHRDLKPDNIFLISDDHVKILDFGLARFRRGVVPGTSASQAKTFAESTTPGMMLGTAGYMSPEQVKGLEVDATSDIFSFGCLMHEMLSGRPPFLRDTPVETFVAILNDPAPDLISDTGSIPVELARITAFCLQKKPADRFQSARELYLALKTVSRDPGILTPTPQPSRISKTPVHRKKSIDSLAVLPFSTDRSNPEMEYLGGVAEAIINALSQTPKLRVMAYGTVLRYEAGNVDPLRAGRELNVRALLSGRVVRRGENFDIQVELIDVLDGARLWGERYAATSGEEEIAQKILDDLRTHLNLADQKRPKPKVSTKRKAYDLYLKGRYFWNKRTEASLRKARDFFDEAILEDSNFALAYSGLADTYWILGSYGFIPAKESYPYAKQYAVRALELDPKLAEAHCSLAEFLFRYDWNWEESVKEFETSLQLNPGYATAHHWYAVALVLLGRFEQAIDQIHKARALDPFSPVINWSIGYVHYYARQYDKAVEQYKYTLILDPSFYRAAVDIAVTEIQRSNFENAILEIERAIRDVQLTPASWSSVAYTYAMAGRREEAEKILEDLKNPSSQPYISHYGVAMVYVGLGKYEEAMDWLERSYEERQDALTSIKVNPRLDCLRSHARFQKLINQLAFPG